MNVIQNGNEIASVIIKCLVLVKIYGISPIELFNMMIVNVEMKMRDLPLALEFIIVLNSIFKWLRSFFQ